MIQGGFFLLTLVAVSRSAAVAANQQSNLDFVVPGATVCPRGTTSPYGCGTCRSTPARALVAV